MIEDQINHQVTLISSQYKSSQLIYNVEKQGVLFLNKLKNKKFRIILNVTHIGSKQKVSNFNQFNGNFNKFNRILLSSLEIDKKWIQQNKNTKTQIQIQRQNEQMTYKQNKNHESHLTISTQIKQMNEKTVIVIMNAYLNSQDSPDILFFGYLISSEILYHDYQTQLSQNSALTFMLIKFNQIARKIKLSTFNQDSQINVQMSKSIRFKYLSFTPRNQKEDTNQKNQFDQFYRFDGQSANSKINKALNTILDFFPIRSSIKLEIHQQKTNKKQINNEIYFTQVGFKQISSIIQRFEQKNMGRKILNYQFTSITIQNLAFQICQYFNNIQSNSIQHNYSNNIQQIYHKIISNTKQSIVDQCLNFYEKLISAQIFQGDKINIKSINNYDKRTIIPLSSASLQQILSIADDKTYDYFSQISLNCMNLHEHIQMKALLKTKIKLYLQNIIQLNNKKGGEFANLCFSSLDIDQNQLKIQQNSKLSYESIKEIFSFIYRKIQCFSSDCISLFTQNDQNSIYCNQLFIKLIKSFIDKASNAIGSSVKQSQLNLKKINSQVDNLKDQNTRIKNDRKKLQQEYQVQMLICEEYKCKLKQFISTGSETIINGSTQVCSAHPSFNNKKPQAYYKQLYRMKKQIQQLEEQIKDKNNHNDDLMEILDKLDDSVLKGAFQKKNQSIFNQQTKSLIHQLNHKINTFYSVLDEVKKVQKQYESAKNLLIKEKDNIMEEKKLFAKESNEIKSKLQKSSLQNKKWLQILNESKQTIEYHKKSNQIQKKTIQELQKRNVQFHCSIADLQAQSQTYKKCVVLLIEQILKGKSQSLLKFFKYLSNSQLKQLLKPVLSKK